MPKFKVWDPQNESLCSTTVEHEADDAEEAAEAFATDDPDGMTDYERGLTLLVRSENGITRAISVTVEYEPSYHGHAEHVPAGVTIDSYLDDDGEERFAWMRGMTRACEFSSYESALKAALKAAAPASPGK